MKLFFQDFETLNAKSKLLLQLIYFMERFFPRKRTFSENLPS